MSYSQSGEDLYVRSYFANWPAGTLLSLGENDGTTLSNVRDALERGWKGVLVEPIQEPFRKLQSLYNNRPEVVCYNFAVGVVNGKVDVYVSGDYRKLTTGILSTLLEEETLRWKGTEHFEKQQVRCRTFDYLLDLSPYKQFDLISIDIEGMDYDVLKQMDLTSLDCKMLIVENNGKDEQKYTDYMRTFGMRMCAKNAENLIYIRETK